MLYTVETVYYFQPFITRVVRPVFFSRLTLYKIDAVSLSQHQDAVQFSHAPPNLLR